MYSNLHLGAASESSPTSPSITEFRKRSLPPHIIESQKKEALTMITEKESSEDTEIQQTQPSFFVRYFYKPRHVSGEDRNSTHRFSFLSRGFITVTATICLIIIATICGVLASIYVRRQRQESPSHLGLIHEAIFANFPDPAVIKHEDLWYAFGTTNAAGILAQPNGLPAPGHNQSNVQLATSRNFRNWTLLDPLHDPLPEVGTWAKPGFSSKGSALANVWAPAVIKRPLDGRFVMYYSAAAENATRSHCIGAAISNTSSPAGPYRPLDTTISCPISEGGAIDATPFVDVDGSFYLAWKVDGNNVGHGGSCGNTEAPLVPTPIKLQKMKADGVTAEGPELTILDRIEEDGPLVEAPVIVRSSEGVYFLFFSSGCTREPTYDVKYAWAHDVKGPYQRANKPLLKTGNFKLLAPGSVGIAEMGDGTFGMAFHARVNTTIGRARAMYTSNIRFNGTEVSLVQTKVTE